MYQFNYEFDIPIHVTGPPHAFMKWIKALFIMALISL